MRNIASSTRISIAFALLLLAFAGGTSAQPLLATGADAQVTEDGLHRLDPSVMPAAWIKPDLDLSGYTKLFFMPATVSYLALSDQQRVSRIADTSSNFPISEVRQTRLRGQWAESFHGEISALDSFELVDYVGRDVLLVRGMLVDVASGIPPLTAGSSVVQVMYPWESTIVLDLQDSMSDEILARTVDRRRTRGPIDVTAVEAGVGLMLRRWSQLLCARLEELAALDAP